MKTIKKLVVAFLFLVNTMSFAQVGIETTDPKTTLQVEGQPANINTPDGVQAPVLTLAQLDAKIAAYVADQDGAIVYVDDVSAGSTTTETAKIITPGYYYYDATNDLWEALGAKRYSVGDFAQGGIVFWVDDTGQHGLVCVKEDQSLYTWNAGTFGTTQAKGDGSYAGEANTTLIIAAHIAIGDNGNDYAARICNELQITEGGITYGDWYLPSREELNLMYQNKAIIDATALANGGSSFANSYYWSSTEFSSNNAFDQLFTDGTQGNFQKNALSRVRAIRAF